MLVLATEAEVERSARALGHCGSDVPQTGVNGKLFFLLSDDQRLNETSRKIDTNSS